MPRPTIHITTDLSIPDNKRQLFEVIETATGEVEVTIEPRRTRPTAQQRKFYYAVVVAAFSRWCAENDQPCSSEKFCHSVLEGKFIGAVVVDKNGEILDYGHRSIRDLNPQEFNQYLKDCRGYLERKYGIVTRNPDPNWKETE